LTNKAASDELGSILEAFGPALISIDIRTVAGKLSSEGNWVNLITSILITKKTVDEVITEQKKLPEVVNDQFGILHEAIPFDLMFFENIAQLGLIPLQKAGSEVEIRRFSPYSLRVFPNLGNFRGAMQQPLVATGLSPQPLEERNELWTIARKQNALAKRLGCSDYVELIKEMLQIDFSDGDSRDILIVIESPARLESATFNDSTFVVEVCKSSAVRNLQLNLFLKRKSDGFFGFEKTIWKKILPLKEELESKNGSCLIKESVELEDLLPFDQMNVELLHANSALTLSTRSVIAPLKNVTEPCLKTLDKFIQLEDLKKMLLDPYTFGKEPNRIFEIAVSWLLSLAGLNPIYLGFIVKDSCGKERRFDSLKLETGYDVGCADILAYKENDCILIIDCDIGPIDDKKIQRLSQTCKHFDTLLPMFGKLRFLPILFTPQECSVQEKDGVRLVGRNEIESIFEELAKGNRDMACSKILSSFIR
jgi:hypothetical protein